MFPFDPEEGLLQKKLNPKIQRWMPVVFLAQTRSRVRSQKRAQKREEKRVRKKQ
jgi:hypothetical protein